MELHIPLIIVPPLVALMAKAGIYGYAYAAKTHTLQTRLYLLFLFAFSLQNIVEIFGLYRVNTGAAPNYMEGALYYSAVTAALALFFHLAMSVSFNEIRGLKKGFIVTVYGYAAALAILFISTRSVITDFEILQNSFGLSITRVRGPLYGMFELFVLTTLIGSTAMLAYGMKHQESARQRSRSSILLLAIIPTVVTGLLIIGLLRFGIKAFNASVTFPIAITYFLALTAYATHQLRIFDITFFIPWSKVRKRKTAFYDRIRATVAEIADLTSVNQIVNRLADTLHCPVALIGGQKPVLALAGESFGMARFPLKELQKINQILVANEIAEAMPATHALMRRHKVAAIVPFHPHSQAAASWMLLGERFSEEVYTPLDFRMVELLFDRIGDVFLDKLLLMRTQLADAQKEMHTLHRRLANAWEELEGTRKENQKLRVQNAQLLRQHATTVGLSVLNPPTAAPEIETPSPAVEAPIAIEDKTLDDYVAEFEAKIIEQVLKRCEGNKAQAARLLGLRPNTLHYKIERYGLIDKIEKK